MDCETCPIRTQREALSPANLQALRVYDLMARRVVVDFSLEQLVFEALRLEMRAADVELLIDQLSLIHNERNPIQAHG